MMRASGVCESTVLVSKKRTFAWGNLRCAISEIVRPAGALLASAVMIRVSKLPTRVRRKWLRSITPPSAENSHLPPPLPSESKATARYRRMSPSSSAASRIALCVPRRLRAGSFPRSAEVRPQAGADREQNRRAGYQLHFRSTREPPMIASRPSANRTQALPLPS